MHEEGHLLSKQHPDKTSPCPGRIALPEWKGYMASNLWWDMTLEDTDMNKENARANTTSFLKQNEKRELLVVISK